MRYTKEQLQQMTMQALFSKALRDGKYLRLVLELCRNTSLSFEEVEWRIERMASGRF